MSLPMPGRTVFSSLLLIAVGLLSAQRLLAQTAVEISGHPQGAQCSSKKWHCQNYDMRAYNALARARVARQLDVQARNGVIINQTVWNHHFKNGLAELLPGGMELLNRIARRSPYEPIEIFLQTVNDVAIKRELIFPDAQPEIKKPTEADLGALLEDPRPKPFVQRFEEERRKSNQRSGEFSSNFSKIRAEINEDRRKALETYFERVLGRTDVAIYVHDPPPAGIPAEEAALGVKEAIESTRGTLPEYLTKPSFFTFPSYSK